MKYEKTLHRNRLLKKRRFRNARNDLPFECPECKSRHADLADGFGDKITEQYCPDCEAKTGQLTPMRRRDA
jgi:ribosomal protein L44E